MIFAYLNQTKNLKLQFDSILNYGKSKLSVEILHKNIHIEDDEITDIVSWNKTKLNKIVCSIKPNDILILYDIGSISKSLLNCLSFIDYITKTRNITIHFTKYSLIISNTVDENALILLNLYSVIDNFEYYAQKSKDISIKCKNINEISLEYLTKSVELQSNKNKKISCLINIINKPIISAKIYTKIDKLNTYKINPDFSYNKREIDSMLINQIKLSEIADKYKMRIIELQKCVKIERETHTSFGKIKPKKKDQISSI
jgi:hypothetical protein